MTEEPQCPLTPALLRLLEACEETGENDDRTLAEYLHLSPRTINTEFKRIFAALEPWNIHSRHTAQKLAERMGWVTPETSRHLPMPKNSSKMSPFGDCTWRVRRDRIAKHDAWKGEEQVQHSS